MAVEIVALTFAVAAASMTLIGWLLAVIRPAWRPRTSGSLLLAAAAAMILVSTFELLPAAAAAGLDVAEIVRWGVIGAFVVLVIRTLGRRINVGGTDLERSAIIVAVALAIHNIPEGAAPYAATLISVQGGLFTAIALGLHNVAEGLAVATPVMASGGTRRRAFWLTLIATLGEIAGAVIAFRLTGGFSSAVAGGLIAFVAGVMIAVCLLELIPAGWRLWRFEPPVVPVPRPLGQAADPVPADQHEPERVREEQVSAPMAE